MHAALDTVPVFKQCYRIRIEPVYPNGANNSLSGLGYRAHLMFVFAHVWVRV